MDLTLDAWLALLVTAAVFVGLQIRRAAPVDLLFLGGLVALTLTGVLTPKDALSGFSNQAVITIGALFAAAAGLRSTGVLDWVGQKLLGSAHDERTALRRMALSCVPVSAFVLNTPMVAMLAPVIVDWCRKHRVSPSRLLMPLSYLTILGGVCTLIGTSTTLVVNGWLKDQYASVGWTPQFREQLRDMSLFELGRAGLPCAVVGTLYLLFIARRLLPNRTDLVEQFGDERRDYLVEMQVEPHCPLIGQTVEAAGLRHLPGLYLIEIDRGGDVITPVTPDDAVQSGDRMFFAGDVATAADLESIAGLNAVDRSESLHADADQPRFLTETVVAGSSTLVGKTPRETGFRERFNAAIVAVHRDGMHVPEKIGEIRIQSGDTLLLQSQEDLEEPLRSAGEFESVHRVGSDRRREFLVEMQVKLACPLVGQTVEAAGLRHLPGLFLIEIDRFGEVVTPVTPQHVIQAGDRLVFTGVVTTIADLEKIPGLVPAADVTYEFHPGLRQQRHLTEAVLSRLSPVVGSTVRQADFRKRYNAAIVAVHRNGVRLRGKIGDIRLQPGDTLLLQTRADFVERYRHSREFYLVSQVGGSSARRHDRAGLAALLFVVLILWLSAATLLTDSGRWGGLSSSAIAAIAIAGLMVVFRCLTIAQARTAIDLQVLLTIAAALGIGAALEKSGAAKAIAIGMVNAVPTGLPDALVPYVLLAAIYLMAMVFTEMITNVAVAAMLLPLAAQVAHTSGYSPRPFVMAIALAASLSFVTPIGYQTNLMVMGPGGYMPRDYLRVGLPLAILVLITALASIPLAWSFEL